MPRLGVDAVLARDHGEPGGLPGLVSGLGGPVSAWVEALLGQCVESAVSSRERCADWVADHADGVAGCLLITTGVVGRGLLGVRERFAGFFDELREAERCRVVGQRAALPEVASGLTLARRGVFGDRHVGLFIGRCVRRAFVRLGRAGL